MKLLGSLLEIAFADVSQISSALAAGFVPVLHGDAVLDHSQGCTILSGDVIIRHLAQHLLPEYVVFLTDVLGVYDRPPTHQNARLLREIAVDEEGNWLIVNPTSEHVEKQVEITVASHDTTGGMETKILEAAVIAKLGVDVYITKAGTEHSLRALKGEITDDWLGTVIRSSKKQLHRAGGDRRATMEPEGEVRCSSVSSPACSEVVSGGVTGRV